MSYKYLLCALSLLCAPVICFAPAYLHAETAPKTAFDVVKAYLRATHARDLETAYRYISSRDRRVQDRNSYFRSQDSFSGFALDLAKKLAADMVVWVVERQLAPAKARFEVGYRAPTADELSSQLRDWNQGKLNALSPAEQTGLIQSLENVKRSGKMITVEGRETFDLVLERTGWKVFLDWGSQQRVVLKTQPGGAELAVAFHRRELLVKPEEPFQVDFKITNRSQRAVVVKLNHVFAPRQAEKNIDMIACGSLTPFSLRPQETQEFSSAYILRGNIPKNTPLEIFYDFRLASSAANQALSQVTAK